MSCIIKKDDLIKDIQRYIKDNDLKNDVKTMDDLMESMLWCADDLKDIINQYDYSIECVYNEQYDDAFSFTQLLIENLCKLYKGDIEEIDLVRLFRNSVNYSDYDAIMENFLAIGKDEFFYNEVDFYSGTEHDKLPYLMYQEDTILTLGNIRWTLKDTFDEEINFTGYILFDYLGYINEYGEEMDFIKEFYPEYEQYCKPEDMLKMINNISVMGSHIFNEKMNQYQASNLNPGFYFNPKDIAVHLHSLIDFGNSLLSDDILKKYYTVGAGKGEDARCLAFGIESPIDTLNKLKMMDYSDFCYDIDTNTMNVKNNKDRYSEWVENLIDEYNAKGNNFKVNELQEYAKQLETGIEPEEIYQEQEEEMER